MERVRREIDRAFEQVGGRSGGRNDRTFPTAFLPGRAARAYPLVNVSEDADALYVTALAPGLDPTAIQLTVQDNRLTIAGGNSAWPPRFSLKPFTAVNGPRASLCAPCRSQSTWSTSRCGPTIKTVCWSSPCQSRESQTETDSRQSQCVSPTAGRTRGESDERLKTKDSQDKGAVS